MSTVPAFRPCFEVESLLEDLRSILISGQITAGPWVQKLEDLWTEAVAQDTQGYAIAVSSGFAALRAVLSVMGRKSPRKSAVILSTANFYGDALAIEQAGFVPLLVDCDDRLQMSVDAVRSALERYPVSGVLCTHIGGYLSPHLHELAELCAQHRVWLVEDASHAAGASLGDCVPGHWGIATIWSMFATKTVAAGEGGMIFTRDERLASRWRAFRNAGRVSFHVDEPYDIGEDCRLSDLLSAVAVQQIETLPQRRARRQKIVERYVAALDGREDIIPFPLAPGESPSWYKFLCRVPEGMAKKIADDFARHDVELGSPVYAKPLHRMSLIRSRCKLCGEFPQSERWESDGHIAIPAYEAMTDEQVDQVVRALEEVR